MGGQGGQLASPFWDGALKSYRKEKHDKKGLHPEGPEGPPPTPVPMYILLSWFL
jgi:hypothetical protein